MGNHRCSFFSQPPLTLVNKQIRSESLPLFYGNNKFIVDCLDNYYVERGWRFPQLRRRWKTPTKIPEVSVLTNFDLVTKLDLRYAFWGHDVDERAVEIDIYMRKQKPDDLEWYEDYCTLDHSGEGLKSSADMRRIFLKLIRITSSEMEWALSDPLIVRVFQDLNNVIKSLLFFAKKCPLATGWIQIKFSAERWEDEVPWTTLNSVRLVSGSSGSGPEGSSSEDSDSDNSGESGSEGSGPEWSGSEGGEY